MNSALDLQVPEEVPEPLIFQAGLTAATLELGLRQFARDGVLRPGFETPG
jgi:hypothetical protein